MLGVLGMLNAGVYGVYTPWAVPSAFHAPLNDGGEVNSTCCG